MLRVIKEEEEDLWYSKGLHFKCTGCGKCCTGSPGYVFISEEEVQSMAAELDISPNDFARLYLRRVNGKLSLIEKRNAQDPSAYDCIFLEDNRCRVYQNRPTQCRTFPWWPQNLSSPEAWAETAIECEGISDIAPIVPIETIHDQLEIQLDSRL
jgi:uncharacterized protein